MARRRKIPLGRILLTPVLNFLMWLLVRVKVEGAEQIPATGAGIVYYNHIHWIDPVVIAGRLPRYGVPLAKVETRSWPLVGLLLRWYPVIFITRGAVDRDALNATWEVLRDGDISLISPEGTRSHEGPMLHAKEGLAFIAKQVPDIWLIPCAVTGTQAFSWSLQTVLHHPVITLRYGRPFKFIWPEQVGRDVLREMTDEAMAQLVPLLPPEMHGAYAGADPQQHKWVEFLGAEREA